MTLDEFFAGQDQARPLFEAVRREVEAIGPVELRVSKSQIAFRQKVANTYLGKGIAIPHGLPKDRDLILRTGISIA